MNCLQLEIYELLLLTLIKCLWSICLINLYFISFLVSANQVLCWPWKKERKKERKGPFSIKNHLLYFVDLIAYLNFGRRWTFLCLILDPNLAFYTDIPWYWAHLSQILFVICSVIFVLHFLKYLDVFWVLHLHTFVPIIANVEIVQALKMGHRVQSLHGLSLN